MAENQSNREVVKLALLVSSVLVAVYVGAYYAMVKPVVATSWVEVGRERWRIERLHPDYRVRAISPLFVVIHRVDRSLRPSVWTSRTYQEPVLERSAAAEPSR